MRSGGWINKAPRQPSMLGGRCTAKACTHLPEWLRPHLPSSGRLLARSGDHRRWVPTTTPGWRGERCGFAERDSTCLTSPCQPRADTSEDAWSRKRTFHCDGGAKGPTGRKYRNEPFRMSKQIRPSLSTFGWYIFVKNRTLGGPMGYSPGRNSSRLNVPPWKGDCIARGWVSEKGLASGEGRVEWHAKRGRGWVDSGGKCEPLHVDR